MKYKKLGDKYIIRLFKGEKIVETLTKFLEENKITAAYFSGIGAVSFVEIAHYDLEKKEYPSKKFEVPLEIISLAGNISLFEGKPMIHAHMAVSDKEMNMFGGHLKEATVSATCEVILKVLEGDLVRKPDEEIGLNLLEL